MDISPWPPASHRCLRRHPDLLTRRAYRESTSLAAHTRPCDNKPVSPLCACTDSSTFLPCLERPLYSKENQVAHCLLPLWLTFQALPWGLPSCPGAHLPCWQLHGQRHHMPSKWTAGLVPQAALNQPGPFTSPAPCFFSFSGKMMPPKGIKEYFSSTPPKYKAQRTEIKAHRIKQGVLVEGSAERASDKWLCSFLICLQPSNRTYYCPNCSPAVPKTRPPSHLPVSSD